MRTFLMHPDRSFRAEAPQQADSVDCAQDIELEVLLSAAAAGDRYLYDIMSAAVSQAWTNDGATIRYRQEILKDCLSNGDAVRQFYALAIEPFDREKSWHFGMYGHDPSTMVSSSIRTLQSCLDVLRRLKDTCNRYSTRLISRGFQQFFSTLEENLDNDYLDAANADLDKLTFRRGVLLSAELGDGGKGVRTMLREPAARDLSWLHGLLTPGGKSFTLQLDPRDEAGSYAFGELRNRGLGLISDALWQSARHVLSFFAALRAELAFYVACVNLHEQLRRIGEAAVFPEIADAPRRFTCRDLRDTCLSLTMKRRTVGNDVEANDKNLVIITGANRGGKSTFLRSVGLAQVMLQCGMFVTAEAFCSSLHAGLATHYKREEDRSMRSGKFDDELVRMSAIAERIRRGSLVLFNESFAATNEREGSEIAKQIVSALLENDVMVFFVSHMYEFARSFLNDDQVLFLRADRGEDGTRSFRLHGAKPLRTSFGADLYQQIFVPSSGS